MAQNTSAASSTHRKCSGIIARNFPLWGTGPSIDYWAENGYICYYDNRDSTPEDRRSGKHNWRWIAKFTLAAFAETINEKINPTTLIADLPAEKLRAYRFLEDIGEVIKAAMKQEFKIHEDIRARGRNPIREMLERGEERALAPPMYVPGDMTLDGDDPIADQSPTIITPSAMADALTAPGVTAATMQQEQTTDLSSVQWPAPPVSAAEPVALD